MVKDGEFEMDSFCEELQKKARLSANGAVVTESDFNSILTKFG